MTATEVSAETGTAELELRWVDPKDLVPNPLNAQRDLGSPVELKEMVASIRRRGVLQPIRVREVTPKLDGTLGTDLLIELGHRRTKCAIDAGLRLVPVLVRSAEPVEADQLLDMVTENTHRKGLSPVEEAKVLVDLASKGLSQDEIAAELGRSKGHVSKRLKIMRELPPKVIERFDSGELGPDLAYKLTSIADDPELVEKLALKKALDDSFVERAVDDELARRKAEKARAAAAGQLERDGIEVIALTQLANESVVVCAGQASVDAGASYLKKHGVYAVVWLGMDVDNHVKENRGCHVAAVVGDGEVIFGCAEPAAHADVVTLRRSLASGVPTVAELEEIVARNLAAEAERNRPADVEPEDGRPAWHVARDAAAVRRRMLRTPVHGAATGTALVETFLVSRFLDDWSVRSPRGLAPLISSLLGPDDADTDTQGEELAAARALIAGLDRSRAAVMVAAAWLEDLIFSDPTEPDDDEVDDPEAEGLWWDFDYAPGAVAEAYVAFLKLCGIVIGPVEQFWLEACLEEDEEGGE